MQYIVQSADCPRLFFRLAEVNTGEFVEHLLPQLHGGKIVKGSTIDGFLLSSIESAEELDAILTFPSLIHKKTALRVVKEWQSSGVPFLTLMADKAVRTNSLSQGENWTQPQSAGKAHNVSFSSPVIAEFGSNGSVGIDNRVFSESGESALSLTQSTGSKKHGKIQLSQSINPEELPFQFELLTQREILSQGKNDTPLLSQDTHSSLASSNSGVEDRKKRKSHKQHKEKELPPKKVARKTLLALASSSSSGGSSSEAEDSDKDAVVVDTMQYLAATIKAPAAAHFTLHEVTRLKSLVSKYSRLQEDGNPLINWAGIGMELGKPAHECHAKYQELKPKETEISAAPATSATTPATGSRVIPSTQSSATSSISRATSNTSNTSSSNGSGSSSDGSSSSGSSSGSSSSSASPTESIADSTANNGTTSTANATTSGATKRGRGRPPAIASGVDSQGKTTATSSKAISSSAASTLTKDAKAVVDKSPRSRTPSVGSSTLVEGMSIESFSDINKALAKPTKAKAVGTVAPGTSNGLDAKKSSKSRYVENKTKDRVTIRPFKDGSEKAFLEHVSHIASDEPGTKGEKELRGLEFVIFTFIRGSDKHKVVNEIVKYDIPAKVMTYVANPACEECALFQSLKIVCNILNYAGNTDRKRLLESFVNWGLLPCLYSIIHTSRDINVVQHVILCLSYILKIDKTSRKAILVDNGMLEMVLEILTEADDYKLYQAVFDSVDELFGKTDEEMQELWTETSLFEKLYFVVGKAFHIPWSAAKSRELLPLGVNFVNNLMDANIQEASEVLLQSSLCSDIICWLNAAPRTSDDLLNAVLNLLHNFVEACEPHNQKEIDIVMSCDPVPILLANLPKSKAAAEEVCFYIVATLAYITDFIPHRQTVVTLFKNDLYKFVSLLNACKGDIKLEARKCFLRILEYSTPEDETAWSTKGLLETLLKLLHDYRSNYETNTAQEDEERHEEEYRLKQMLRLMGKILAMTNIARINEDKTLYIDDWIEISAWVAKMHRHDREVMELLKIS